MKRLTSKRNFSIFFYTYKRKPIVRLINSYQRKCNTVIYGVLLDLATPAGRLCLTCEYRSATLTYLDELINSFVYIYLNCSFLQRQFCC